MNDETLAAAPFKLDGAAIAWVREQFSALSQRDKLTQLFNLRCGGNDPSQLDAIKAFKPGGVTHAPVADATEEIAIIDGFHASADIPLLVSADLEGSRMSLPFGTQVLNPLGLAAVNDVEVTRQISQIMADEAHAVGINWSLTPCIDINAAFRSAIVGTRGFGTDVAAIESCMLAQISELQKAGVAATAKHFPGEGYDDRDQHLVTTINPLSLEEWEPTFGRLYRAAIDAGVLSVMSAHIALPSFVRSLDPRAGVEAFRPAVIGKLLNQTLLREQLGFNGLIVSDSTNMAGFGSWASRKNAIPEVIANGCDMILFSRDPEGDVAALQAALDDGRLTEARIDDALYRILALKAALGLHRADKRSLAGRLAAIGIAANVEVADRATRRAPTLVKDTQNLLPLSPETHHRVLVVTPGIIEPYQPPLPFAIPDLLRAEGFEVTLDERATAITPDAFDLVLYLFGEETLLTRSRIGIDWAALGGNLQKAMYRPWHDIPTAMISFGYPYMLYDAPRVPTYINAYATMESMQCTVVDGLLGRLEWNRHNPVDPFCGLEDARY